MGGEVSTDFKSSNRIEISQLVQVLLNFDWFWGPPGRWGWVDGGGVVRGCPHACAHTHTCMYDIIQNSQGLPQWRQPFAWSYHPYHACMCTCVGDTPNHPQPPSTQPPTPRAVGSPKHQNSISLELIEIIRFCWRFFTSEHSWTHIDYS